MVVFNTKDIGSRGEQQAESFFIDKEFQVLERNYRYGKTGEIDLIIQKKDLIVFVEVKTRSSNKYGGALYSISNKKKETIRKVARYFLQSNPHVYKKNYIFRFDMIAIENGKVNWISDMFR